MTRIPDGLPVLSRGRHRRPRQGACAMELVSVLAGERWSDAPRCTHPLLSRLARAVNDTTSDAGRGGLVPLLPDLVGLTGPDPRWDLEITLAVATHVLPLVPPYDQRPLAAAVLTAERALAALPGASTSRLRPESREALAAAPGAAEWATQFVAEVQGGPLDRPGPAVVDFAVRSLTRSGVRDLDAALRDLLAHAVAACLLLRDGASGPTTVAVDEPATRPSVAA